MKFDLLVNSIEQTHSYFQEKASKAINVSLTIRNWLIGFYIVNFEQNGEDRAKYGEKLLVKLAERCATIKGLDERTFRNFRLFYLHYPQIQKVFANQVQIEPIRRLLTSEFQPTEFQLNGELIVNSISSLQNTAKQ